MSNEHLRTLGFNVTGYKCFRGKPAGFDRVLPINLIIGKNNSGKSSLLDLLELMFVRRNGYIPPSGFQGAVVNLTFPITQTDIDSLKIERRVQVIYSNGSTPMGPIKYYLREYCRDRFECTFDPFNGGGVTPLNVEVKGPDLFLFVSNLVHEKYKVIQTGHLVRLSPDRDIRPERANPQISIDPNGNGATNTLVDFLVNRDKDRDVVRRTVLDAVNEVFRPDGQFNELYAYENRDLKSTANGAWEIFIGEAGKGLVPLSQCGHGLKTIILVMSLLHLGPQLRETNYEYLTYAFEELENNLHPALLRRLLLYLKKFAKENGCRFFLTTHSNVAIDLLASDEDAQIIHVQTGNDGYSTTRTASDYKDFRRILEDLDVRASDLLQANCVVWVEGPSDRIYFNKWVELVSGGQLIEGVHYACMIYGGSILTRMSMSTKRQETEPEEDQVTDFIRLLHLNCNAIILMDSDMDRDIEPNGEVNECKRRIAQEVKDANGYAWITDGREIENYLPPETLKRVPCKSSTEQMPPIDPYIRFSDYIEDAPIRSEYKRKVPFANLVTNWMERGDLVGHLDLEQRVETVCEMIRRWNCLNG